MSFTRGSLCPIAASWRLKWGELGPPKPSAPRVRRLPVDSVPPLISAPLAVDDMIHTVLYTHTCIRTRTYHPQLPHGWRMLNPWHWPEATTDGGSSGGHQLMRLVPTFHRPTTRYVSTSVYYTITDIVFVGFHIPIPYSVHIFAWTTATHWRSRASHRTSGEEVKNSGPRSQHPSPARPSTRLSHPAAAAMSNPAPEPKLPPSPPPADVGTTLVASWSRMRDEAARPVLPGYAYEYRCLYYLDAGLTGYLLV